MNKEEMKQTEALKLALEFIERVNKDGWILADFEPQMYETITVIRKALAHPEQYPQIAINAEIVGYVSPQRTWVGLTRTDLIRCGVLPFGMSYELCQAIEAKLKDKNTRGQE